jgi:aryl-alcohol dehydrogenase-like predicted oxidoreductase
MPGAPCGRAGGGSAERAGVSYDGPVIERAMFGRTGHASSRVIFGAAALMSVDQETADRLLPALLRHGVNHLDTAAAYGDSELRLAPWLAAHPGQFFLATKTGERRGDGARRSLEQSLERLGVGHVDLIQLHNLVEEDEWATAHGPGGALEALVQARHEGLVRFIGVTGHGTRAPGMHLRSLDRFDYDSVLVPYNFLLREIDQYRRDLEALLERCAERQAAVQTIKSVARRRWPEPRPEQRRSWYEPLEDQQAIGRAVRYVLGRPRLFLNSSSDYELLPAILAAAEGSLDVPPDSEMRNDADRFEMAALFDGAALERI